MSLKKPTRKKASQPVSRKSTKKKAGSKNKGGRPTDYRDKHRKDVYKLCLLGATDDQLADFFGVAVSTISKWKTEHPRFLEALKDGKDRADAQVANSLFQRANGYSHPEEKIFYSESEIIRAETTKHYPPDPTSMIFWLKNRQRLKWRDRHEVDHSGGLLFSGIEITYAGEKNKE